MDNEPLIEIRGRYLEKRTWRGKGPSILEYRQRKCCYQDELISDGFLVVREEWTDWTKLTIEKFQP